MEWTEFTALVRGHDLTYSYSDDPAYYHAGVRSFDSIRKAASQFPLSKVRAYWNSVVDTKLIEGYRSDFYWQDAYSESYAPEPAPEPASEPSQDLDVNRLISDLEAVGLPTIILLE
jgi:hypothetical protein